MTDYTWNNPLSGNWDTPGDWTPYTGSFPGSSDIAELLGSSSTTALVTNTDAAYELFVENPRAKLDITSSPANLYVYNELYQTAGAVNSVNSGYEYLEGLSYLYGGSQYVASDGRIINYGTVYQDGTRVTLGPNGEIYNASGAYWDILDNGGIGQTGASSIVNYGVFEKTGGSGDSRIAGAFQNNGNVFVGVGKLEFRFNETGGGTEELFNHASTLQFDREASGLVNFTSFGQTIIAKDLYDFHPLIDNFQAGDTIKVTGAWAETNYFYNGTNTIVDLERGGITEAETFAGYVPGIQVHTGLANTTITHA
jgi:hypothetical protein